MNITLAQAKELLARYVDAGVCVDDSRVVAKINEAQERLARRGNWEELFWTYTFCTADQCITLPRELKTAYAAAACKYPLLIRNGWYEYDGNGPGLLGTCGSNRPCGQMVDRGDGYCTFRDLWKPMKVRVYADLPEDAGKQILFKAYDEFDTAIRTLVSGVWVEGMYVNIDSYNPAESTGLFSSIYSIQKPITNGVIRIYALDTDSNNQWPIAYLQPTETNPTYRRYLVPGSGNTGNQITVRAKRRFIPAVAETDELMLSNVAALKLMILSIYYEESNKPQEAQFYLASALQELQFELKEVRGDGTVAGPRIQMRGFAPGRTKQMY